MGALLFLFLGRLAGENLLLVALALKARIAAGPQGQLSAIEVEICCATSSSRSRSWLMTRIVAAQVLR